MSKILILDAFKNKVSGAQKVTLNVTKILNENYSDLKFLCREGDNPVRAEYIKNGYLIDDLPFENNLEYHFGKGDYDGLTKIQKVFKLLLMIKTILKMNYYLIKYIRKNNIKKIYTYDPRGLVLVLMASILTNSKLYWHLHSELKVNKLYKLLIEKLIFKVIVPSKDIDEKLSVNNSVVIYNGFEFDDVVKDNNKSNKFELLYVGAITPQKGLHFILEVMNLELFKSKSVNLSIIGDSVGDSSYKDNVLKCFKENKNITVNYLGWCSDDISKYYIESDVVLFSSLRNGSVTLNGHTYNFKSSEALPTVPIEAISYGTPVVSLSQNGINEIIKDNTTGFIVDSVDVGLFADNIIKAKGLIICSDIINKHRMKFSINSMKENILNVFGQ